MPLPLPDHYAMLVGASALLAACATTRPAAPAAPEAPSAPPPQPEATAQAGAVRWTATLAGDGASPLSGSATVVPADSQHTRVIVTLTGATPRIAYPWHIHVGRCGDNGPVVGVPAAYPPLSAGADSTATVTATLPFATPMSGNFYVNVHRSVTEAGTAVACGNLEIGTR